MRKTLRSRLQVPGSLLKLLLGNKDDGEEDKKQAGSDAEGEWWNFEWSNEPVRGRQKGKTWLYGVESFNWKSKFHFEER